MKKKILLFLIVFFLGTINIVADDFSDCLTRERLKEREKGMALDSATRQAIKYCNLKLTKREKPKQKLGRPYFGLDLIVGAKRVCGNDCENLEEERLYSTMGAILDVFIVSNFSFSSGILESISKKYPYQDGDISTQAITELTETTYGIRLHFKNASGKSGVDIYLGGGAALIAARKTADNLGEIEKNRGTGQYAEGGVKYVSQWGYNFGYYARVSSVLFEFENGEQDLGGFTNGIFVGWTF